MNMKYTTFRAAMLAVVLFGKVTRSIIRTEEDITSAGNGSLMRTCLCLLGGSVTEKLAQKMFCT